jgi:tRNA-Thr(GGU) m(6)t(6)A37 methyltransferase TsaA
LNRSSESFSAHFEDRAELFGFHVGMACSYLKESNRGRVFESMDEIKLIPIGEVHTHATPDEIKSRRGMGEAEVEVYERFEDALDGLEGFSHIFVIGYFHQLRREQVGPLRVRPRGLLKEGLSLEELPTRGVFALDSPTRPNPVSLSLVRLVRMEGKTLHVTGLDLFDGTPVLDIKPYQPQYRAEDYRLPEWYIQLREKAGHV